MKTFIIVIGLFFIIKTSFGQNKTQIYFLADTIHIRPENRILEIGTEGSGHYYMFYCQCLPPYGYGYNVSFGYLNKNITDSVLQYEEPNFKYISWKKLSEILVKEKYDFHKKYDLFITEVLKGNKFKTNKVNLTRYREPIKDISNLESKQ